MKEVVVEVGLPARPVAPKGKALTPTANVGAGPVMDRQFVAWTPEARLLPSS